MEEYWNNGNPQENTPEPTAEPQPAKSDKRITPYDHRCHALLEKMVTYADPSGWKAELRTYLASIPADVSRHTDIIAWWSVSHLQCLVPSMLTYLLVQANSKVYPTLSRIAMDVCAIPTSSVPCECLFSTGSEITTDWCSHLGSEKLNSFKC